MTAMEKIKVVKYIAPPVVALGAFVWGINQIENAIEDQGDRLESEMVEYLDEKTLTLTDALNESTDGATDDLKEYIGNITIEDLMGD